LYLFLMFAALLAEHMFGIKPFTALSFLQGFNR
ncbi:MAG: hypothetical protein RLZZ141_1352, partial [Pseudomonadota bacterium]